LRLIAEVGLVPPNLARRTLNKALEQIRDPLLKHLIGGPSNHILEVFGLQELVDRRVCKRGIGTEVAALELASVAGHDRLRHVLPAVGTMDVAGRNAQRSRSENWLNTNSG